MRYDVMNEYYTEIRLFGKPALFNDMRLEQETVPKGLYLYEVRYDDETWEPVQIAKGILANHLGSVLTRERLKIPANGYLDLEAKTDWKYKDKGCRTVQEFLEKYPEEYRKHILTYVKKKFFNYRHSYQRIADEYKTEFLLREQKEYAEELRKLYFNSKK